MAAACHDFQHLACNNNFLVRIQHDLGRRCVGCRDDELAWLYNDQSVLENHHISASLKLTKLQGCNFMSGMVDDDIAALRDVMINMVLATGN